jgi:hypothetical protein
MRKGESRANKIRETKRSEIIESLKARGLIQKVVESAEQLADLSIPLEPADVTRITAASNLRMGLIKKYMPDVKQTELVGENGDPIKADMKWTVELVDAATSGK